MSRAGARRAVGDAGNAMLEFCFLGLLLMVPLTYVMLTVFHVQSAAYAAASATREAARAVTTTDAGGDPWPRAFQAAQLAMGDHGLELAPDQLDIACSTDPCLAAAGTVRATVEVRVALPLMPRVLGDVVPASVRVHASHLQYVDRFRAG